MTVVVLTGASGSGKTTIAQAAAERYGDALMGLHFDAIGVPSVDAMVAKHGSPAGWQRAKTFEWMPRIAQLVRDERSVLFEGQMRLAFLADAATASGLAYTPILVDCDDAIRARRLTREREQPELADAAMMEWAAWLRREATEAGGAVLDTSHLTVDEAVVKIARLLDV